MAQLDPDFLAILRCPLSLATLIQDGDWLVSTDAETRRRYRIDDGIPVLLIEEAEEMAVDDWKKVVAGAARQP
ncbi:MAG: hypothetical protein ISR76_04090 [Planctomycetes bacterium]|nr:hypothetical protein [Planctomycetota bacterium]MBL7008153.1 hypothetical protein [Planctomycetota bacterium]